MNLKPPFGEFDMIEFKSGRKMIKSVSSVDEALEIIKSLVDIRNDDSMWEFDESSGTLGAWGAMDKVMGKLFDIFDTMSVWEDGKKVKILWKKGF